MTESTHSPMFETIKYYYTHHLWNLKRVRNAVAKNQITTDEYKEITGKDY